MNNRKAWIIRICFVTWMILLWLYLKLPPFNFLILNTFLAYIPIELSFHINSREPKNSLLFWIILILWLMFYPNTPYLLTDLFHLSLLSPYNVDGMLRLNNTMWFNFTLLLVSALFSVIIGTWGLDQISGSIKSRYAPKSKWLKPILVIILTTLSSVGIFIGRFLRIHTVYLFITPMMFVKPLLDMWNEKTLVFIFLLTFVQLVLYSCLKFVSFDYQTQNQITSKKIENPEDKLLKK